MTSTVNPLDASLMMNRTVGDLEEDEKTPAGGKSALVLAAEAVPRSAASLSGYLRKKNSADKWQKRWFEIVGQYWVYYKRAEDSTLLCAMDLWRAGAPGLEPPAPGDGDGALEFHIT